MMDEQELIASGKLELYVAGILPEDEMADIAAMAMKSPLLAMEIEKIEQIMIDFLSPADSAMRESEKDEQIDIILEKIRLFGNPKPGEEDPNDPDNLGASKLLVDLRGELEEDTFFGSFSGIDNKSAETSRLEAAVASIKILEPASPRKTFLEKTPPPRIYAILRVLVAAMVIAIILMCGWIAWLIAQNIRMEKEADTLRAEITKITASINSDKHQIATLDAQAAFMANPHTYRIEMKVVPSSKLDPANNYALVFWSPEQTLITDARLPALRADQQYQLWALYQGKPIDAGVFDPKQLQDSNLVQKSIAGAQAFAITVEPKGGSAKPTMSTLTLKGKL